MTGNHGFVNYFILQLLQQQMAIQKAFYSIQISVYMMWSGDLEIKPF